MAQPPFRDLPPRYDVKGGSPRTPSTGIPVREVQEYSMAMNGSGVWKTLAGAAGGLWIMSLVAWWTAFQGRGITREELRNEMKEYKDTISKDMAISTNSIGRLEGEVGKITTDLQGIQYRQLTDEQNFTEFKAEQKQSNKLVADWMEAQKTKK